MKAEMTSTAKISTRMMFQSFELNAFQNFDKQLMLFLNPRYGGGA